LLQVNANSLRANAIEEGGLWRYVNRPVNWSIGGDVRKAAYSLQNLMDGVESVIEDEDTKAKYFLEAEALCFITTAKIAFGTGVRFGTGILINRLPGTETGWSAPCAIGSFGVLIGLVAGAEVADIIIPLKAADALEHFKKNWSVTLGGEAGFAFGPVGRTGAAEALLSQSGANTALSLSNAKGIYGGLTLDGSVLKVRHDINKKFYGKDWTVTELLDGTVPCPPAGKPLYDKLAEYKALVLRRQVGGGGVVDDEGGGGAYGYGRLADPSGYARASSSPQPAPRVPSQVPGSMKLAEGGGGGGDKGAHAQQAAAAGWGAGMAYDAYRSATPAQRQAAYGAAKGAYDSATPEQRQAARGAIAGAAGAGVAAAAAGNAPDDVFV